MVGWCMFSKLMKNFLVCWFSAPVASAKPGNRGRHRALDPGTLGQECPRGGGRGTISSGKNARGVAPPWGACFCVKKLGWVSGVCRCNLKCLAQFACRTTTLRDGVVITCSGVMLQSCSLSRCAFFGVVVSVTMRVGWSCGCSRCHGQRVVARIQ